MAHLDFHVAPFALQIPASIRLVGNLGGPDIGGFVLMLPRSAAADTWRRYVFGVIGGPLASWLLAAFCFGVNWMSPSPLYFVYGLGLYSLATALLSSWPNGNNESANDAELLARAWRKPNPMRATEQPSHFARLLWAHGIPLDTTEAWMRTPDTDAIHERLQTTRFLDTSSTATRPSHAPSLRRWRHRTRSTSTRLSHRALSQPGLISMLLPPNSILAPCVSLQRISMCCACVNWLWR